MGAGARHRRTRARDRRRRARARAIVARWKRPASRRSRARAAAAARGLFRIADHAGLAAQPMTNPLARLSRSAAADRGVARHHARGDSRGRRARSSTHGFRILEVPLNSPRPFESIAALRRAVRRALPRRRGNGDRGRGRGAGGAAGGRLIVMPHADIAVIREAKRLGLVCVPGVATPTEAFAALAAGADGLKMFPADQLPRVGAEGVARGAAAGTRWYSRSAAFVPTTWRRIGRRARMASAPARTCTAGRAVGRTCARPRPRTPRHFARCRATGAAAGPQ